MCQITREAMEKQHTQKITLDIHLIQLETLVLCPYDTVCAFFSSKQRHFACLLSVSHRKC